MPTSEVSRAYLDRQSKKAPSAGEDYVAKLPRLDDVEESERLSSLRNQNYFEQSLRDSGLNSRQRAAVTNVLGKAGFVAVGDRVEWGEYPVGPKISHKIYQPTVGDIRAVENSDLIGLDGIGERSVKVLRALFGREEEKPKKPHCVGRLVEKARVVLGLPTS